jgi:putative tricarboxylic transport membrane protein
LKLLIISVIKDLFVIFETGFWCVMKKPMLPLYLLLVLLHVAPVCFAFEATQSECLAPAKLGGGMDLTCKLVANSLFAANLLDDPMIIKYRPGGIGAVAYNYIAGVNSNDPGLIVAASSGSALNIAIKKFGQYDANAVRWLGALGTDYGAIAVSSDAPWDNLNELVTALRDQPQITIGGGGSIGSQDWIKIALLMKEAGIDPKSIRYVAFEGGGEALSALFAGYIQIFSGDASELHGLLETGPVKVLAILSPTRLPGKFANIPTAREQGYPVDWQIWRGYYMGPGVSDDAYNWWVNSLRRLVKTKEFELEREKRGLFPFSLFGDEFNQFVQSSVKKYRQVAIDMGLLNE